MLEQSNYEKQYIFVQKFKQKQELTLNLLYIKWCRKVLNLTKMAKSYEMYFLFSIYNILSSSFLKFI